MRHPLGGGNGTAERACYLDVDFDGRERDFVFDDLNRETAENWMSGGTAFNIISTAYNAAGQVTSTGDDYSDYAFGYNGQGEQTSVDNAGTPGAPHVVLTSGYDAQGNRTSLAATLNGTADFLNNYSYDSLSRLRDITQQGQSGGNAVAPKSIYIGLNGVGNITELDYGNSVTQGQNHAGPGYATLTYSPTTGLLTGINDVANGTSIDNLAYTYDPLARVSTFASIDGTASYGYDHTSQLVSATYTTATGGHQPSNVSFTWDANGNNAATGNVVSSNNEVTNDGTFTYTFDANGNRTSKTRISSAYATDHETVYSWDYRNRLTDIDFYDNNNVLTKHVHLVYDVYDNLIGDDIDPNGSGGYTTRNQFIFDATARPPSAGGAPLETFDASGNLTPSLPDDVLLQLVNAQLTQRFLNGPSPGGGHDVIYAEGAVASLTQPDVPDWLFVNNQGSPTDVVNSSGTLIDHQVYSAFGQLIYVSNAGVFVLQGFSGGFSDPNTGFIKFGERWYDATASVWVSFDSAGFHAGDANLGRYAGNTPNLNDDPSGLETTIGGLRDALVDIADSIEAQAEAEAIAAAIAYTYEYNWRLHFPTLRTDDRVKGIYCYEWAYAFEDAFNIESSGDFFEVKVQAANTGIPGDNRVHFWIQITSTETGKTVYVDDGFGNGSYVNGIPPIPNGWEPGNAGDPGRSECNPPPAYNRNGHRPGEKPQPPTLLPPTIFGPYPNDPFGRYPIG